MSTFTNWNGPQASNVRASDLIELANAYSNLTTQLSQHINASITNAGAAVHGVNYTNSISDASSNKVHTAATVTEAYNSIISSISTINSELAAIEAGTSGSDSLLYKSDIITGNLTDSSATGNPVSDTSTVAYVQNKIAAIDPAQFEIDGTTLPEYVETTHDNVATLTTLVNGIANVLQYDSNTTSIKELTAGIVAVNDYVIGMIRADTSIDFTKDSVVYARNYVIDDSSTAGDSPVAVYIVGELSELWDDNAPSSDLQKSATVMIKMTDSTYQFNVMANVVATQTSSGYKGAISALCAYGETTLENLQLHLISGSNNNTKHVYVALSSDSWANDSALIGVTDVIVFEHVSGINFIPATRDNTTSGDYPTPARAPYDDNDQTISIISSVSLINGFSASDISFESITPESISTNIINSYTGDRIMTYSNGTIILGNGTNTVVITQEDGTTSEVATKTDFSNLIGQISIWPILDSTGSAVNIPSGYYALSESTQTVTYTTLYPDDDDAVTKWAAFATALGYDESIASITLPAMTGGIIRIE